MRQTATGTDHPNNVAGNMRRILKKELEPDDLVGREWQAMRAKLLQGQILQGLEGHSKGLRIYPEDNGNPWKGLEQRSDMVRTMCGSHLGCNVQEKLE